MPLSPESLGDAGHAHASGDRRGRLEALLVESLPVVAQAVRVVAQRNRLRPAETEDLASEVKLALVANDYRALDQFQGRSSLKTYLVTLVQRVFIDQRRRVTGKWRPSAEAERLGPVAIRLELLLRRDELSLADAIRRLRTELAVTETDDELAALTNRLPARFRARPTGDGDAAMQAVPATASTNPEATVVGQSLARAVRTRLVEALRTMEPEDRLILRMRFERDMTLADVARGLGLDQKQVYRRVEKALAHARNFMTMDGLAWHDVERSVEQGHCDLRFSGIFGDGAEIGGKGPSTSEVGS